MTKKIIFLFAILTIFLISSCSAGNKIQLNLIDEQGNQIANADVKVQQIIYCFAAPCDLPVLFEGKTDKNGKIMIKKEFLGHTNIAVEEYYIKTVNRGLSQTEPFNVFDDNLIVIDKTTYNLSKTREITVILEKLKN